MGRRPTPGAPLVVNHTGSAPVFAGKCVEIWADDVGLWGRWKILDTRNGDEALAEASAELSSVYPRGTDTGRSGIAPNWHTHRNSRSPGPSRKDCACGQARIQ